MSHSTIEACIQAQISGSRAWIKLLWIKLLFKNNFPQIILGEGSDHAQQLTGSAPNTVLKSDSWQYLEDHVVLEIECRPSCMHALSATELLFWPLGPKF